MKKNKLFSAFLVLSALTVSGCEVVEKPSSESTTSSSEQSEVLSQVESSSAVSSELIEISSSSEEPAVVLPIGIELIVKSDITNLEVGDSFQVYATVYPLEASQDVTWSSSDESVATVSSDGFVAAVGAGKVFITATSVVDGQVSQRGALIINEKAPVVIDPTTITVSSENGLTSIQAGEYLQLSALVGPEGASQDVTWTTSNAEVATVNPTGKVQGMAEGTATITATSKSVDTVSGSFNLTVTKAEEVVTTVDWSTIAVSTHDEYINMAYDKESPSPVKVKGKVAYVTPVSSKGLVNYYIENGFDGYYVYGQDPAKLPVSVGKCYEVGGFKKVYQGTHEICDIELCSEIDEAIEYSENDISELAVDVLADMNSYLGSRVVINKVTITSLPTAYTKAYNVKGKTESNHTIDLRVDPANMSDDAFTAINSVVSGLVVGSVVEARGFMSAFGYGKASPQVVVVSKDDIKAQSLNAADVVTSAKNSLSLKNSITLSENQIDLPTTVDQFENLSVSWTSDNAVIASDGTVTHPEHTTDVKLTATLSFNGVVDTKDLYITVFGTDDNLTAVHTLDLEDASTEVSYGCSATKPSYDDKGTNKVRLGNPTQAEWYLRNALIAGTESDRCSGTFSIRTQSNADQEKSGRIELCEDFEFSMLEFRAGVYGGNALGITLMVSYSNDGGQTWTTLPRTYVINTTELETIRVAIPLEGAGRVAIDVVAGTGQRVNVDDIRLLA